LNQYIEKNIEILPLYCCCNLTTS